MSQTSVIFFALFIGFVVYITIRGHLSGYLYILGLSGTAPAGLTNTGGIGRPGQPGLITVTL